MRFSWAKVPDYNTPYPFQPGAAFKFLRDNEKSGNVMAMASLAGVNSSNFFEFDLTNHVPNLNPPDRGTARLKAAFDKVSFWPTQMGLSEMASFDDTGRPEPNPKFPYRLIFHAPPDVRAMMKPAKVNDFPFYFMKYMTSGKNRLYDVYAEDAPPAADGTRAPAVKIGEIDMVSAPVSSMFSDRDLFFQHTRMEDDYAFRPDWIQNAFIESNWQLKQPYYLYPNLADKK